MHSQSRAVILSSGGLDSTTVLAYALKQGFECHTLAFDYGQRHRIELIAAENISRLFGATTHKQMTLDLRTIGGSALTDDAFAVPESSGEGSAGIPITYVPARNTIFLSMALGYAEVLHAEAIFIGVNAVDYSGYPDCRPEYIDAFRKLAALATREGVEGHPVRIETPLIHMSKAKIIQLGISLGVDYSQTVSCYQANVEGRACGKCDSCFLRKEGFLNASIPDPTTYLN